MIKSALHSSLVEDIKYNSMSAGTVPSSEYLITTTALTQNEPSVTFDVSAFNGVYRHLQIVLSVRQSASVQESRANLTINGSNGVRAHYLVATGATTVSNSETTIGIYTTGNSAVTNNVSPVIMEILDAYSTTKNKTIRILYGLTDPGFHRVGLQSGLWENTAAINTITLTSSANFLPGSRFSIYGVTA